MVFSVFEIRDFGGPFFRVTHVDGRGKKDNNFLYLIFFIPTYTLSPSHDGSSSICFFHLKLAVFRALSTSIYGIVSYYALVHRLIPFAWKSLNLAF